MTKRPWTRSSWTRNSWQRDVRIFAIGGGAGVLAGALLAGILIWHYAPVAGPGAQLRAEESDALDHGLASIDAPHAPAPAGTSGKATTPGPTNANPVIGPAPGDVRELVDRDLEIPVEGVGPNELVRSFADKRDGRHHEAIDILAPRSTPVKAVEGGTIARLFFSQAGGTTVYQFDPSGRYCYYYAHLEGYAPGLKEGDAVRKGQVLGYVGTSGNAPKNTPHLHFAVFRLTADRHWWEGTALDPYDILR